MIQQNSRNFWFALLVVLSSVFYTFTVSAQAMAKECDEQDPEKCSQPLLEGEPAPFTGQLLTPKLAITLGQRAASFDVRLELEMMRLKDLYDLELNYQKELNRLDKASADAQIKVLERQLKEVTLQHWYEHPLFIATISVVATVLVLYGSAYLLQTIE